jgi:hypothetical protein
MSADNRFPAAAGASDGRSFGTASVSLHAPQLVFEMIRAQVAGRHGQAVARSASGGTKR